MNDYCYKPKGNSLPKLNLATLTTGYKSFYSNNSKNKMSSSYYNTQRIHTTKANTSIYSSGINSNEPDKINSKTKRNLMNEKPKKNKKKKIKSNIIYLTEISKNQTDDDYFAMSEIAKIDNTINKRINKNIIWKEKLENKYDMFSSTNRNDIINVKNRVRHDLSGVKINLRKEVNKNNYFPPENIETIKDANEIIKRIKASILEDKSVTKKYNHFNKVDLHTFREQNRDICLNNLLINIIKTESNKLKKKENIVNAALKEANNDFEKDKITFEKLTKNEMSNFRMKELKLDETIKQNRVLIDEIKKINSDLRSTKDEVRKYIKEIQLFIRYENFIKKLIAIEKNISNCNFKNITKINYIKNNQELDIIIKNIIKEYYNDDNENSIFLSGDINPEIIVNLFLQMESNIINALELRDLIIKEIDADKKRHEDILDDLRLKVEQNKKSLDILLKEFDLVNNISNPKKNMQEIIRENEDFISILYNELSKYVKDKTIMIKTENICFNTFNLLHKLEDKLLNIMNELDLITENNENTDIFKNTIEQIKLDNKKEKQTLNKSLVKKLIEEKHKKLQQRMIRFKIRGPIIYPPPWVINKSKKKKKIKKDEKAENEEILFY